MAFDDLKGQRKKSHRKSNDSGSLQIAEKIKILMDANSRSFDQSNHKSRNTELLAQVKRISERSIQSLDQSLAKVKDEPSQSSLLKPIEDRQTVGIFQSNNASRQIGRPQLRLNHRLSRTRSADQSLSDESFRRHISVEMAASPEKKKESSPPIGTTHKNVLIEETETKSTNQVILKQQQKEHLTPPLVEDYGQDYELEPYIGENINRSKESIKNIHEHVTEKKKNSKAQSKPKKQSKKTENVNKRSYKPRKKKEEELFQAQTEDIAHDDSILVPITQLESPSPDMNTQQSQNHQATSHLQQSEIHQVISQKVRIKGPKLPSKMRKEILDVEVNTQNVVISTEAGKIGNFTRRMRFTPLYTFDFEKVVKIKNEYVVTVANLKVKPTHHFKTHQKTQAPSNTLLDGVEVLETKYLSNANSFRLLFKPHQIKELAEATLPLKVIPSGSSTQTLAIEVGKTKRTLERKILYGGEPIEVPRKFIYSLENLEDNNLEVLIEVKKEVSK